MKEPIGRPLSPVPCSLLLRLFPFCVIMDKQMNVLGAGKRLVEAWGDSSNILNKQMNEIFKLRRPKGILFTWKNVCKLLKQN